MEDINFKNDISSMLEVEVGFKGRFILEQQCQRMEIDSKSISNDDLKELSDGIHQALTGFVGPRKAEMAYAGILEYVNAVDNIKKSYNNSLCLAKSYVVLGDKQYYIKRFDESMRAYRKAQDILVECNKKDLRLECQIKRKLARVLSQSREHYEDAKNEYVKVIELGNLICDYYDVSLGYIGLGTVAWQEEEYTPALEYFNMAHASMEKLGVNSRNEKEKRKRVEGLIHMALADLHLDLQDIERSLSHNERAIDILLDLENYLSVGKLYKKMRMIYQQKKEYDKAINNHKEVAFNAEGTGPMLMEGWTRMNLASLLMEDGKFNQAEEHLSRAYEILSGFDYPEAHSKLHYMYGNFYHKKKELDASEIHFIKSLDSLGENNAPEYIARAQEGLGTLYLFKGEKEKGRNLLNSALAWHEENDNYNEAKRITGLLNDNDDYCPVGIALL